MSRRSMGALAALMASVVAAPGAAAPSLAQPAEPAPAVLIEGKGFGHGVGMAQDGAFAMAGAGASATDILQHFYPGTTFGRRTGPVHVGILDASGPVVVSLPGGGELREAGSGATSPGFPVTVSPGGTVQLSFAGGAFRAKPLSGASLARIAPVPTTPAVTPTTPRVVAPSPTSPPTTSLLDPLVRALTPTTAEPAVAPRGGAPAGTPAATVPAVPTEAVSGRGLSAVPKGDSVVALPGQGRSYRGTVQAAGGGGGLQLTNVVDVEQYLRGMGEVPAGWPAAALQAHAIAARTFAMSAAEAGKTLCDDQQCQVYIGAGNEHPATNAAATATRGRVLLYRGALAEAVYSASAGGVSATPEEGFGPGSPDVPYLQPAAYPTADPQPWSATMPLRQLAARFGYRGELTGLLVSRAGPSGRPLEITFDGVEGPMVVDGHRFWRTLDLRSSLYTLRPAVSGAGGPLDAIAPDLPGARAATPGRVLLAGGAPSLGRTPWVGLAALLLACWALGVGHTRSRRAPTGEQAA